jgi:hypothetical protein
MDRLKMKTSSGPVVHGKSRTNLVGIFDHRPALLQHPLEKVTKTTNTMKEASSSIDENLRWERRLWVLIILIGAGAITFLALYLVRSELFCDDAKENQEPNDTSVVQP